MTGSLSTWFLAGALVASLAWNVHGTLSDDAAPASAAKAVEATDASTCRLDGLELDANDIARLNEICATTCSTAETDEARSLRLNAELFERLADPDADPEALRERAREVGRLRARTLEGCVEAVLQARTVLEPEAVEGLVRTCLVVPIEVTTAGCCESTE